MQQNRVPNLGRRRATSTSGTVALLIALASGCSSDDVGTANFSTVPAKGKVTVAGKAATKGIIVFEPTLDGGSTQQASGEIHPDGTFELRSGGGRQGAMPGKYRVKVESDETRPRSGKPATPTLVEVRGGEDLQVDMP